MARICSRAACLTGAVWLGPGPTQAVSPCHGRGHDGLPGGLTAEAKAVSGLRPGAHGLIPRGMLRGAARAGEGWEAPERRRPGKRPEARPWVHGRAGDMAWCSVGVLSLTFPVPVLQRGKQVAIPGLITERGPCCHPERHPCVTLSPVAPVPSKANPSRVPRSADCRGRGRGKSQGGPGESTPHAGGGGDPVSPLAHAARAQPPPSAKREGPTTSGETSPVVPALRRTAAGVSRKGLKTTRCSEDKLSASEKHRDSRQRPEDSQCCGGQARGTVRSSPADRTGPRPDDSHPGREARSSTTLRPSIIPRRPPPPRHLSVHRPSATPHLPSAVHCPRIRHPEHGIRSPSESGTGANDLLQLSKGQAHRTWTDQRWSSMTEIHAGLEKAPQRRTLRRQTGISQTKGAESGSEGQRHGGLWWRGVTPGWEQEGDRA